MSIQVNKNVVSGMPSFSVTPSFGGLMPKIASPACLSQSDSAPWTNRTPQHEPWPRGLQCNSSVNGTSLEPGFNTSHNPQFIDDGGIGSHSINRIEGSDTLPRGQFWRR